MTHEKGKLLKEKNHTSNPIKKILNLKKNSGFNFKSKNNSI